MNESHIPLTQAQKQVLQALQRIRFGTVCVQIHDSKIVQVEQTEKIRFRLDGQILS